MREDFFDPDSVNDRESFIQFVQWLIADRVAADRIERADPQSTRWDGAMGWQNASIAHFLESALAGAEAQADWGKGSGPSWKDLAVFLYLGKIYE